MIVEPAVVDDAEALTDLWVRLADGQRHFGSHLYANANRTTIREALLSHITTDGVLVARDEVIVGFVMYSPEVGSYEQDVRRGIVHNIYVDPDYRNGGVGSELLAAAERRLVDAGVDVVALEAMARNEGAIRLYERHGYERHRIELEKRVESDKKAREEA